MGSVGKATVGGKFADEIPEALEYYSQDGYAINNYLRSDNLNDADRHFIEVLDEATKAPVKHDTLYRIVDPSVVFGKLDDIDSENLRAHLLFGDNAYDKGAYSQGIKQRMQSIVDKAQGTEKFDKGYMSTTYDYNTALSKEFDQTHSDGGGVILKITNARQLKGAEIGGEEKEVLLQRGHTYKFGKIYKAKDGYHIIVETEIR